MYPVGALPDDGAVHDSETFDPETVAVRFSGDSGKVELEPIVKKSSLDAAPAPHDWSP